MKNLFKIIASVIAITLLAIGNVQAAPQVTYYHHDALGSVIATSDEFGIIKLNEEYQPYGEKIYQAEDTGSTGSGNEDWYTGKNYSKELDLTYFGARWYDAKQGRFISMDPAPVSFANVHSFNRYHYANSNPYKYVDPDGRDAIIAVKGNNVNTTLPIEYSGSGATPLTKQKFNSGIEKMWSGKIGKYNVKTTVTNKAVDGVLNKIYVPIDGERANVVNSNSGTWPQGRPAWTAAHEAGHLMGLPNRYNQETGEIEKGYENNIMAAHDEPAEEKNIDNILKSKRNKITEE